MTPRLQPPGVSQPAFEFPLLRAKSAAYPTAPSLPPSLLSSPSLQRSPPLYHLPHAHPGPPPLGPKHVPRPVKIKMHARRPSRPARLQARSPLARLRARLQPGPPAGLLLTLPHHFTRLEGTRAAGPNEDITHGEDRVDGVGGRDQQQGADRRAKRGERGKEGMRGRAGEVGDPDERR